MKSVWFNTLVLGTVVMGILSTADCAPVQSAVTPQDVQFVNNSGSQSLTLTGKLFVPPKELGKGPFPAVVLMHGCSGLYYTTTNGNRQLSSLFQEWGNRLATQGYVAIFPDSFTPRKNTTGVCNQPPEATGISEVKERPTDAYAAYYYLRSRPDVKPDHIGLLGWSNGGSATLAAMSTTNKPANGNGFRTAIAFYPGCGLRNQFGGVKTSTWQPYAPFVIYHGTSDPLYKDGFCEKRMQNAKKLGATIDLKRYQNAKHGFDMAKPRDRQWTQADLGAKQRADNDAMVRLNTFVQNAATGSRFEQILPRATYEAMFPKRNTLYTYDALVTAAQAYPKFGSEGSLEQRKREVAAFLANIAHETRYGSLEDYTQGLHYIEEQNPPHRYCDETESTYPRCIPERSYHGRGPIQLSWNYNYGPAGRALGLNLLQSP